MLMLTRTLFVLLVQVMEVIAKKAMSVVLATVMASEYIFDNLDQV